MGLNSPFYWKFGNNSRFGLQKRVLHAEARSPPNKKPQGINPLGHLGAALSSSIRLKLGLDHGGPGSGLTAASWNVANPNITPTV